MEEFFQAKQILLSKKEEKNYYYLLFATFALLNKYPKDIVEYVVSNTDIYIEPLPLDNMVLNHPELNLYMEEDNVNDEVAPVGLSYNGIGFNKNEVVIENPKILLSSLYNNSTILNGLIHEFSHIIKSFFKSYSYSDNYFTSRTGIFTNEFFEDGSIKNTNQIFEEVINTLQTRQMCSTIKNLDYNLFSKEELQFFKSLDLKQLDSIDGYENIVCLFDNLWQEELFRDIFEEDSLLGNISLIKDNFNNLFGNDLFDTLSIALDDYFEFEDNNSKELIKSIISLIEIKIKEKQKNNLKIYKNVVK